MGDILRVPNNNALLLTPRTASHSLCVAAIHTFWPETVIEDVGHPAWYLPIQEIYDGNNTNVGIIIRNPIERFRSMVAHRPNKTIEEHLTSPVYGPIQQGNFVKYFRFEDQLQECAEWLGITKDLPIIDSTEEKNKPILTYEQEIIVRNIYAKDIELWESLNG